MSKLALVIIVGGDSGLLVMDDTDYSLERVVSRRLEKSYLESVP